MRLDGFMEFPPGGIFREVLKRLQNKLLAKKRPR
jgi:hypothetical protein